MSGDPDLADVAGLLADDAARGILAATSVVTQASELLGMATILYALGLS